MKVNKIVRLSICFLFPFFILGCSNDYQVDNILTGTIEKILMEEEILVIKGYGEEGSTKGNIYEIPVEDPSKYEIGQKIEITIYSNTDADVWDLDRMKFDVKMIDK